MIGLFHFLALATILFCIGLYGVLTRRNAVAVLMSLELMFNAVNINLVAFNHFRPNEIEGIVFSLFIIAVAACEATVGVALVLSVYRNQKDIDLDKATSLRW